LQQLEQALEERVRVLEERLASRRHQHQHNGNGR
jgi:hypothetical protein